MLVLLFVYTVLVESTADNAREYRTLGLIYARLRLQILYVYTDYVAYSYQALTRPCRIYWVTNHNRICRISRCHSFIIQTIYLYTTITTHLLDLFAYSLAFRTFFLSTPLAHNYAKIPVNATIIHLR